MKALDLHSMLVETMNKSDHVLIIGFGRGGQTIGRILAQENIPYYALDLDVERVQVARKRRRAGIFRRRQTPRSIRSCRLEPRKSGCNYAE